MTFLTDMKLVFVIMLILYRYDKIHGLPNSRVRDSTRIVEGLWIKKDKNI